VIFIKRINSAANKTNNDYVILNVGVVSAFYVCTEHICSVHYDRRLSVLHMIVKQLKQG
jgi:hypothetical protein